VKFGLQYGYFPEPGKSYYICKAEDEDAARQAFESFGLDINYSRGQHYLRGFIGSAEKKGEWLVGMVDKWAAAVVTLSTIAERYPQTAHAGFTFCMQNEWQYVQRVVANTAPFFSPLEEAIRMHFLPALLGVPSVEIDGEYRQLLTNSVKLGGLAIRNPVDTAPRVHKASLAATCHQQCPLWILPLGLTRGLIVCAPPKQARQLKGIGSRMSRSFSTVAGKNLPWRGGTSKTVPLAHGFRSSRIG
jgi:hypothetical protein